MNYQLIVIGNDLHRVSLPGDYLGTFSSHGAAFEAMMRVRQPDWQPMGATTFFTPADVATFERLRGVLGDTK